MAHASACRRSCRDLRGYGSVCASTFRACSCRNSSLPTFRSNIHAAARQSSDRITFSIKGRAAKDRGLGRLVDQSQAMTESLLGNQVRETVWLASFARKLGAAAASAFGAGFGGSVWALVQRTAAESFLQDWQQAYRQQFPARAPQSQFLLTAAGPPCVTMP